MAVFLGILNALSAIPAIAAWVDKIIRGVIAWWVGRQQAQTLSAIADAAAFAARAQTEAQRYEAAQKWHDALSRARVTP